MQRLRAGLAGLTGPGLELFDTLRSEPLVELVAVADRDRSLSGRLAEEAAAACYDDYRLLIVESATTGLEALFVALPVFETEEYLPVAAGRALAVFVVPPFARTFDTAVEMAGLFAQTAHPLVVARTWQLNAAGAGGSRGLEAVGHVFAAHGQVTEAVGDVLGWRGDSRRAGGGVLLHGAYQMVDAVVALLGVPDAVFAATGFGSHPEQVRAHDTEDAAAMTFRYADDRVATIACRRAPAESSWELTLAGTRATAAVTHPACAGGRRENGQASPGAGGGLNRFRSVVKVFAQTLAAGAIRFASPIEDHLGTMATISAAYLSVRTGQVESPHKFLELADAGRR